MSRLERPTLFNFSEMFSKSRKMSLSQVKANPQENSPTVQSKEKFFPKYPYERAWIPQKRVQSSYTSRSNYIKNNSMFEERPKSRERNFSQEFETRTEICITPRKSQKSTSKEKKPANSNQTLFCLNLLEPAAAKKRKMKVIIKRKNSETNKPERWLEDELRGKNDSHIFVVRGSKIL